MVSLEGEKSHKPLTSCLLIKRHPALMLARILARILPFFCKVVITANTLMDLKSDTYSWNYIQVLFVFSTLLISCLVYIFLLDLLCDSYLSSVFSYFIVIYYQSILFPCLLLSLLGFIRNDITSLVFLNKNKKLMKAELLRSQTNWWH